MQRTTISLPVFEGDEVERVTDCRKYLKITSVLDDHSGGMWM